MNLTKKVEEREREKEKEKENYYTSTGFICCCNRASCCFIKILPDKKFSYCCSLSISSSFPPNESVFPFIHIHKLRIKKRMC